MVQLFHMENVSSNNAPGAGNQQERLKIENWILGFTDGEGCFSVSIIKNKTSKHGWQVFPEYVITQGKKSLAAVEIIKNYFNCGNIFVNKRYDNHREHIYRYCVRSIKEINEIIVELMNDSAKYWRVGNEKIAKFIPEMNRNKNENISINFKPAIFQQPTDNTFKKQIFTYSFLKAFQQVVINSKNPLEKYIDELLGLYIEAVFGATRLPLWKVYSAGNKPTYEFVGTKYTTMEERKGNILKGLGKDGMKIVSLDVTPLKGSHKISVTILSNIISENGQFKPSYVYYDVSYDPNTLSPVFIAVREFSLEDSKDAS